MASPPGAIRRLWYKWKTMSFPWRRKWLVGYDLHGNTFWEFKDALHATRNRRIVQYPAWTHHGDVKVPPQWMQWLRHTRFEPPTIAEQQSDAFRQQRMRALAEQADAKWAAKPSVLDAPDKQQPLQMLESRAPSTGVTQMDTGYQAVRVQSESPRAVEVEGAQIKEGETTDATTVKKKKKQAMRSEPEDSPWKTQTAKGNPGEEWQPKAWAPGVAKR
ncbi:hypothetical protein BDV95DRAFT_488455 [Massariosphaeria phaeospora]|uniref:Uncharacterized protein n=1 Tax=Massariosphaeria phaeospora TaxID=100035 RepID=A0A7C8IHR5_9PLEO|nr:hypothetical protein BDV95DRAFT_488455 [Massariosphaeria phaeospora]